MVLMQDGSLILHVDGPATSLLDSMGPVVVHEDGTISRVANWDKMTEEERSRSFQLVIRSSPPFFNSSLQLHLCRTLRVLGRRNAARLEKLRQVRLATPLSALGVGPLLERRV